MSNTSSPPEIGINHVTVVPTNFEETEDEVVEE